jgi:hypothetical protein
MADPPLCLLLLPRTLERFILRDQAEDLLRAPGVVAVAPGRVPYGAFGRLPAVAARRVARALAQRILGGLTGSPRVVVIFHPLQLPVAEALMAATGAELWYGRWDRYERAHDAAPALRSRLEALHERAARTATLTFAASVELQRLEHDAGREAALVPLAADAFPAPDPAGTVIAVSLGHLGHRVDWGLLRCVAAELGDDLVLLLVGAAHPEELEGDADFAACRELPQLVWLGERSDREASRLIACADVGVVPFTREPFNDAGLPYRILKYARLGRRTVSPPLAGVATWERAVDVADGPAAFAAALRAQAGRRSAPDAGLRAWALAQTAEAQDAPLWDRLEELGVAYRP